MGFKSQIHQFSAEDVNLIEKTTRFQGFFQIEEYLVSHRLFNGGTSKVLSREIFERGDAVAVMPFDPVRQSVVVVEQFRTGALRAKIDHSTETVSFGSMRLGRLNFFVFEKVIYSCL